MKAKAALMIMTALIMLLCPLFVQAARIYGDVYSIYDYEISDADLVVVTIDTSPEQRMVIAESGYEFEVPEGSYIIEARYYIDNTLEQYISEDIEIEQDGDFRLDLVLFPYLGEEEELVEDSQSLQDSMLIEDDLLDDAPGQDKGRSWLDYLMIAFAVLLILYIIYYLDKRVLSRHRGAKKTKPDIAQERPDTSQSQWAATNEDKAQRQVPQVQSPASRLEGAATAKEDEISDYESRVLSLLIENRRMTQKEIRKQVPASEAKISLIISDLESQGRIRKIRKGRSNIIVLEK